MPHLSTVVYPYLASYVAVGLLLTMSCLLHRRFQRGFEVRAALVMVAFWPLVVLLAPEAIFGTERIDSSSDKVDGEDTPDSNATYVAAGRESDILRAYWESDIPPAAYFQVQAARRSLQAGGPPAPDSGVRFSLAEPEWYVGFTTDFLKSVRNIDRKLQGRILEAIAKIGADPVTAVGDTVKPLTADRAGVWRYRIGDSRLLYRPDLPRKHVTLLEFAARGGLYD